MSVTVQPSVVSETFLKEIVFLMNNESLLAMAKIAGMA